MDIEKIKKVIEKKLLENKAIQIEYNSKNDKFYIATINKEKY